MAKSSYTELWNRFAGLARQSRLISSELPEVMNLSRRILVMRNGRIAGELERADFSQANLMRLMAGITVETV